ncbi:histone deacetylase 6 isoform X1 [Chrysoperla carnea]|uniref:histone deacetylase 6 isoform X1 n=1 Tax=Chrysoperla carnea TaxID=189513 RepID=UPI001D0710A2|nr:histone deacetylase 6 isoform X1 [Chrysoperla carnea]XP_044741142.1 histone deacetylase 6 isoform X1 [Chrysoperla carnea]XP_044741143.1 histone deacetylase 6 isoform X1 [Chrysoperla carnea]
MHYRTGDFELDFNTVAIPDNVCEAIRTNFKQRKEFTITEAQPSDVTETPAKSEDGGSANTDVNKPVIKKGNSLADIKKRARENKGGKNITIEIYDPYEKSAGSINSIRKSTGLITNIDESDSHECIWDSNYPENPFRLSSVIRRFEEYQLYDRCEILTSREATKEEILVAHSEKAYTLLETYANSGINAEGYETVSSLYDAIFINENTARAAKFAAGSCIELVDAILSNKVQNGFAAIRPPGHHAMYNEYNGYCFFNNAVIAARHAINKFGTKRILIVDFDVHHGQGTQDQFYESKNVLYFSIHRYEYGRFWPNLRRSDFDYIGEGAGTGYNFNVPLNETGMTDADYLTIFNTVLMPVAYEYDPELVIISAGYDASIGCPEGEMKVTPQCYAHMTHLLQAFAQGKVAVLLEGGYNPTSLAEGAALTLRALLDDPVPHLPHPNLKPKHSLLKTIRNLILHQKPFWKCFHYYTGSPPTPVYTEVYTKKPVNYPTRDAYPKVPQGVKGLQIRLDILETITPNIKSYLKLPTFKLMILYDEEMLEHRARDNVAQLECPERIKNSFELLKKFGLLGRAVHILGTKLEILNELYKVHPPEYITRLENVIAKEDDKQFTSIFTNSKTIDCALMAVGSGLNLLDRIMAGDCSTALALIRPPGHHAEPKEAMGFCFFNNVAVTARHALDHFKLKRVLIVDFDIHHPNGTYTIFKNDNRCLLISIHRYHANFFPHTGALTECGEGEGIGFNVNIPWTKKGQGDNEYLAAFLRIILPIARQFDPELVLVSAGFDAAVGDPLGQCNVSPEMFGHMAHMLKEVSESRLLFFLEGGYNVTSVSHSVGMVAKALLGDPLVSVSPKTFINEDAEQVIESVIKHQLKYWPILNVNPDISTPESITKTDHVKEHTTIYDNLFSAMIPVQTPYNTIRECMHVYNLESSTSQYEPKDGVDTKITCADCTFFGNKRYECLTCSYVGCPDQINGHTRKHAFLFGHPLVISYEDYSIYCFSCKRFLSSSDLSDYREQVMMKTIEDRN